MDNRERGGRPSPGAQMNEAEPDLKDVTAHSFLLRFWRVAGGLEQEDLPWRGHITHVMSRRRRSIQDLEEIKTFVEPYLTNFDNSD